MKKNILAIACIVISLFFVSNSNAQALRLGSKKNVKKIFSSTLRGTTGCDTTGTDGTHPQTLLWAANNGYVTGTNSYYSEIAGYYDLSASTDNYLNGLQVYFTNANTNNAANLSKTITISLYDNSGGAPGNLLYSSTETLANVNADVNASSLTTIQINPGIALPSSKTFFITFDFSNFAWNSTTGGDSISIATDSVYTQGLAYVDFVNLWENINDISGGTVPNAGLAVFPITGSSNVCSGALPLQLLSFDIQKENKNTLLSWSVTNETNIQSYEVQRANNNFNFTTIQSLSATNSITQHAYSATDLNALALPGNIYYRLKQINKNGSFTYSKVISVNSADIGPKIIFTPNPFTSTLAMQMNLDVASKATIRVYDMQGKFTGAQLSTNLNAGNQSVSIPSTANFKAGTYAVDIILDTKHLHYIVVKQ